LKAVSCSGCAERQAAPRPLDTIASGVLVAAGLVAGRWLGTPLLARLLLGAAMLAGGARVLPRGLAALRRLDADIHGLVTLAAAGAVAIGQWEEGALVVFLFSLGQALEEASLVRTRRALASLIDMAPRRPLAWRDGAFRPVEVDAVRPGDRLLVRPGERVPVDGQVVAGSSWLDESCLTGEPFPRAASPGEAVRAGALNRQGVLEVVATSGFRETTFARIIYLVEQAQAQKAPSQRIVDRFAARYTPLVVALAVATATLPPLVRGEPMVPWLYRALAFLLLACPCALVIATPVAVVSAIAQAARSGILIKGGRALETLGRVRAVAIDKTGTLTEGRPRVSGVYPAAGWSGRALLALAAAVEAGSEHPLGAAMRRAADEEAVDVPQATGFEALPGRGARAVVQGAICHVMRPDLLDAGALEPELQAAVARSPTAVVVTRGREVAGVIAFHDAVRHEAAQVVTALRGMGVHTVVVLSGDSPQAAAEAARAVGADAGEGSLGPEDKALRVRGLSVRSGTVAMVGDGINDAPALAAADVGIAMGAGATDVALETADVALLGTGLGGVVSAIALGRRASRVVVQNVVLAVGTKLVLLALAVPGWLTLWLAVLGDSGVALGVILNSLRLLGRRQPTVRQEPGLRPGNPAGETCRETVAEAPRWTG